MSSRNARCFAVGRKPVSPLAERAEAGACGADCEDMTVLLFADSKRPPRARLRAHGGSRTKSAYGNGNGGAEGCRDTPLLRSGVAHHALSAGPRGAGFPRGRAANARNPGTPGTRIGDFRRPL